MWKWVRIGLVAAVALGTWTSAVWADEVSDSINEALKAYEAGDYSGAMSSLSFATAQLQQMQSSSLKAVFPEPLPGWQAEDSTGNFAPAAFMGGGVSASRHYFSEDTGKSINIEIVTDSPLLQSVMMFMNNPMMMSAEPGSKPIKVKTYKGYQKFPPQERNGEVNLVLQSRMLVSVKGDGIDNMDDVIAYANAINFKGLEEYLAK
jgi:hypothetical protein